jgi:hypothetical protein
MFKLSKNYYSSSKLCKSNNKYFNIKESKNLSSSQSKDMLLFSTNSLRRFYNIGIPKKNDNNKNNDKDKEKEKKENDVKEDKEKKRRKKRK